MNRRILAVLGAVALVLSLGACTPAQFESWLSSRGIDTSHMSDQELAQGAAAATAVWDGVLAEWRDLTKYDDVLSEAQLLRLRTCESGGNYRAVSPSGMYRGAYQFSRSTWDSVAGRHYPKMRGVDPIDASPKYQDSMTRALYTEMGRSPWPVCGRNL